MNKNTPAPPRLVALGDQVMQAVVASGIPVIGFVIVTKDGDVEYRASMTVEQLRITLNRVADAL